MDHNMMCPECGNDDLSFAVKMHVAESYDQPAETVYAARCDSCGWNGDYDDLEDKNGS